MTTSWHVQCSDCNGTYDQRSDKEPEICGACASPRISVSTNFVLDNGLNIIARKPRGVSAEFILVDRGTKSCQFVVGTATWESLENGEWFWGHYFQTKEEALKFFNAAN